MWSCCSKDPAVLERVYRDHSGIYSSCIVGLYEDNGNENGNYYSLLGLYKVYSPP